jgi:hypothetical protein
MKKSIIMFAAVLVVFSCAAVSYGQEVTARSLSSGIYEDGKFTQSQDGFEARYFIDEAAGTVTLEKITANDREGKIGEGAVYDITNIMVSEGLSALVVSKDKKGQRIITAVREAGLGAFETLIIGADFYEYCRAANGKFYLEYGDVSQD